MDRKGLWESGKLPGSLYLNTSPALRLEAWRLTFLWIYTATWYLGLITLVMDELRRRQVFKVANVQFAVMEPSGELNVLLRWENQPLTPKHLGIKVAPEQEPQSVIMDGKLWTSRSPTDHFFILCCSCCKA